MASSVPAQIMYPPPPPPSFGGAHPHNPSHHSSQSSHFAQHPQPSSSSSSYHANPQAQSQHHQHHSSSLPPPPASGQHYPSYATQYPHSHPPSGQHQYAQDRPQERLPSIRDLDFHVHQQQAAQSQHQQQGQQQQSQSNQQQASQQLQPANSTASGGPGTSGSGGASGSAVSPASLVISPARQRRHWGASGSAPTAGPSQNQSYSHHLPHPQSHQHPQALSHSQMAPVSSAPTSSSSASVSASASSSFAPPPTMPSGQPPQYHSASPLDRRPRSESLIGGGSRGSIGSVGSSLSGASGGPTPGLSGGPSSGAGQGGTGGMNAPSASPVTRSPLAVPYGHNAGSSSGYVPPTTSIMGATSIPSTSTMSGVGNAGGAVGSSSASLSGRPSANPHSPYGTAFPSPHTPHLHLHTPLSQGHGQSTSTSGPGTSTGGAPGGGTQSYPRQVYAQYDYSTGYAPSTGTGSSTGGAGAPPTQGEQHAYGGRGMTQPQSLYSALPPSHLSHHAPPTQEPWAQPQLHQTHQSSPLAAYHPHVQHQAYSRSSAGSSSLTGAISGGYGAPLPSHQQAQGHGHMVSPGLTEHDPGSGPVGGAPLALAGGVPVPGSARAHFLPRIQEQCGMLYEFARRYANSSVQPSQSEVEHMARTATDMINLLSEYRRAALAEGAAGAPSLHHPQPYVQPHPYSHAYPGGPGVGLPSPAPEEHENNRERMGAGMRAPKRPWEDIAQESDEEAFGPGSTSAPPPSSKLTGGMKRESISTGPTLAGIAGRDPEMGNARTAAEKDMELIRSKRATNVGTLGPGAPKGKYRKRSQRATPPGKCHSCNIRETPEWRRGPDGARTLCNACGLHYAKLIRKRDKQAAASADGSKSRIEIDMETLRASTRAASEREQIKAERERERQRERERAAAAAAGEVAEGEGEQGVQGGGLGLGLETGINGFPNGGDINENNVTAAASSGLTERADAISTPVALGDTSSNISTGSNGLAEWRSYADADLAQSSFLRGIPAGTVRSASS